MKNNSFTPNLSNDANYTNSLIDNKLNRINTIFLAKILSVSGNFANIQTIIQDISINQPSPEPNIINNVPISQIRGGNAGVILQYKAGDTVLVGAVQRDITNIKQNWSSARPLSNRKFSLSDAVILQSVSNTQPTTFVQITDNSVIITANQVTINSSNVSLGGSGGAQVLTTNSVITAPNGKCTISNPSTTTKAV